MSLPFNDDISKLQLIQNITATSINITQQDINAIETECQVNEHTILICH